MSPSQWVLLLLLSLLWGGSFFFVAITVHELPPLTLVLARVAIAALTLFPLLLVLGLKLPRTFADWAPFLGMSVLNNVIPFLLIVLGQQRIPSGLAAILNATTPVWTLIIAHWMTSDEKLTAHKLVGTLMGLAGVVVLVGPESVLGRPATALGMLFVTGAAVSYGLSALWGRRLRGEPPLLSAFCQLAGSSVMLAPFVLVIDNPWTLPAVSGATMASLLGLAVLSTALAYIVFFRILAVSGPTNVMLVTLLIPASAIALGVIVLGETLLWRHVLGAMVIGSALMVIDGRLIARLRRQPSAAR